MLRNLCPVAETGKQTFAPCGDSTLLALVSERLALSAFVDNDAAIAEVEAREEAERKAREIAATAGDNTQDLAQPQEPAAAAASEEPGTVVDAGDLIQGVLDAAAQS